MWVPLESKAFPDRRVPRVSGATQAWQDPKEKWVLKDTKAWWAPSALPGHQARKVRGGHQAELGRRVTWAAKVFEDPRE